MCKELSVDGVKIACQEILIRLQLMADGQLEDEKQQTKSASNLYTYKETDQIFFINISVLAL